MWQHLSRVAGDMRDAVELEEPGCGYDVSYYLFDQALRWHITSLKCLGVVADPS